MVFGRGFVGWFVGLLVEHEHVLELWSRSLF
jgi:hypothetical protein